MYTKSINTSMQYDTYNKSCVCEAQKVCYWKEDSLGFSRSVACVCLCVWSVCHRKPRETLPRPEQKERTIAGRHSLLPCSTMMSCRSLCPAASLTSSTSPSVHVFLIIAIITGWFCCNICQRAQSKHLWRPLLPWQRWTILLAAAGSHVKPLNEGS